MNIIPVYSAETQTLLRLKAVVDQPVSTHIEIEIANKLSLLITIV